MSCLFVTVPDSVALIGILLEEPRSEVRVRSALPSNNGYRTRTHLNWVVPPQCPFSSMGIMPTINECLRAATHFWEAAFATSCLRRVHPLGVMRRLYSQSVLPRGNGLLGHVHQGYLACAFYQG